MPFEPSSIPHTVIVKLDPVWAYYLSNIAKNLSMTPRQYVKQLIEKDLEMHFPGITKDEE